MKRLMLVGLMLVATTAWSAQMYEWRDPKTNKLMLGDKPPTDGTRYWREGENPSDTKPPASPTTKNPTTADKEVSCEKLGPFAHRELCPVRARCG